MGLGGSGVARAVVGLGDDTGGEDGVPDLTILCQNNLDFRLPDSPLLAFLRRAQWTKPCCFICQGWSTAPTATAKLPQRAIP